MLSIAASGEPEPFQRRAAKHGIGLQVSNQTSHRASIISNRFLEVTGDNFLSRYLMLFSDCQVRALQEEMQDTGALLRGGLRLQALPQRSQGCSFTILLNF
jgi:hypothetical protein